MYDMIRRALYAVFAGVFAIIGCGRDGKKESSAPSQIVIYSSIDEPYLRALMKRFEDRTKFSVRIVTDTEATKSAGLVEKIEAEKDNPRADVYWGNEIFHTINLAERGIFAPYRPTTAQDIPPRWRGKDDLYTPIGLRARMIVVSTRPEARDLVAKVRGLNDLTHPSLMGTIGISNPAFGTGSGHIAALYVRWGEPKFTDSMRALRANDVKILGGNSAVVDQVASGNLLAGLTDNDDIANARADGAKVDGVVPDQEGDGTLMIPTTISLVNGAPNPEGAKQLIDFLCEPAVEQELIAGRFLAYSVRDTSVKAMDVDYVQCAHQMRRAIETTLNILQNRQNSGTTDERR